VQRRLVQVWTELAGLSEAGDLEGLLNDIREHRANKIRLLERFDE